MNGPATLGITAISCSITGLYLESEFLLFAGIVFGFSAFLWGHARKAR
jgi:hypothetical protein